MLPTYVSCIANIKQCPKGVERGEAMKVPFSVDLQKTAIVTGGSGVLFWLAAYGLQNGGESCHYRAQ